MMSDITIELLVIPSTCCSKRSPDLGNWSSGAPYFFFPGVEDVVFPILLWIKTPQTGWIAEHFSRNMMEYVLICSDPVLLDLIIDMMR